MKKIIFAVTILAMLSVLVACNTATTSQTQNPGGNSAPLSTVTQLLVGTFKLEDTDLAVSADQARQLLPLWQTLQELSNSNIAANEEINAVVDQIKGGMTSQQMARITALKLTQQDVMSLMSQAGFSPNSARTTTTPMAINGFPGGNNSQGGGGPAGGGPAGGPPGGGVPGGGIPSGGGIDPGAVGGAGGASTTPPAVRSNQPANQAPAPLLNALIELLQKKTK